MSGVSATTPPPPSFKRTLSETGDPINNRNCYRGEKKSALMAAAEAGRKRGNGRDFESVLRPEKKRDGEKERREREKEMLQLSRLSSVDV
jgi:hypothetical protein